MSDMLVLLGVLMVALNTITAAAAVVIALEIRNIADALLSVAHAVRQS